MRNEKKEGVIVVIGATVVYCPQKPSQNSYLYDISKAVNDFGCEPKYSYIEMLEGIKREMAGHRFDHLDGVGVTI